MPTPELALELTKEMSKLGIVDFGRKNYKT
jgi:hypothetical protein